MRTRGRPIDGWLLLDKPEGVGSTHAVARVRRAFDARRAGHGGTLDPLASGLLPIALGRATRTVPFVMDGAKTYRFTVRFGEARATDDREGDVTARSDRRPDDAAIRSALDQFRGEIRQVPPAYSALRVAGRRAYDLARAGTPPVLSPRAARVDRFELVERLDGDHAEFVVETGKGVYVRSLARDLASVCGTVGHVTALRRTAVGPFAVARAISLDLLAPFAEKGDASPDLLLPLATALADIPALAVTAEEAARLSNGVALALPDAEIRFPGHSTAPDGPLVRAMAGERVVGLCRVRDGRLVPKRLLQPLLDGDPDVDHGRAPHGADR